MRKGSQRTGCRRRGTGATGPHSEGVEPAPHLPCALHVHPMTRAGRRMVPRSPAAHSMQYCWIWTGLQHYLHLLPERAEARRTEPAPQNFPRTHHSRARWRKAQASQPARTRTDSEKPTQTRKACPLVLTPEKFAFAHVGVRGGSAPPRCAFALLGLSPPMPRGGAWAEKAGPSLSASAHRWPCRCPSLVISESQMPGAGLCGPPGAGGDLLSQRCPGLTGSRASQHLGGGGEGRSPRSGEGTLWGYG